MKAHLTSCLNKVKADYAEIRYEEIQATQIHYVGKELERIGEWERKGGGIRTKIKGGWSFVSFNDLENLEKNLELAMKQAHLLKRGRIKLAPVPPHDEIVSLDLRKDPRRISLEEKHFLMSRYNQILLSPQYIQTSDLKYADVHTTKYFVNSEGTYVQQEKVDMVLGMAAIARKDDNIQTAHEGIGGTGGYELVEGREKEAEEVSRRALSLLNAEPFPGGKYTIIVDPKLAGIFAHEAFGHLSEADFLYENKRLASIMRLGRVFGPEELDIIDEAPIKGEGGYYLYDDEGVAAGKTYLIRQGKLVRRLHSRETAAKMGEEPTGNARAMSYQHPPIVRMSNTYIAPRGKTLEEMIDEVEEGLYVKGFRGGETNLEMFTFSPEEGYIIEKGKLGKKARDINLTGNIFTTLSNIDAIGKDLVLSTGSGGCGKGAQYPLPVATGGPHLRIKDVVVGGK